MLIDTLGDTLSPVLVALEESLRVDLIATYDLNDCGQNDLWTEILDRSGNTSLDQFPVRQDGTVVGVLERDGPHERGNRVLDVMRSLDDSMLVAASTGILSYIDLAATAHYHLVVRDHQVRGIVTPSDLRKLPVRIVLFTLITHLESTMAATIRRRFADGSWEQHLPPARRGRLDGEYEKLKGDRLDVDKLLLCQLCDKREIIATAGILPADQRSTFCRDLEELEKLRNDVMHANDYRQNALRDHVDKAKEWIHVLTTV